MKVKSQKAAERLVAAESNREPLQIPALVAAESNGVTPITPDDAKRRAGASAEQPKVHQRQEVVDGLVRCHGRPVAGVPEHWAPIENFGPSPRGRLKLQYRCRDCARDAAAESKVKLRKHRDSPEGRAQQLAWQAANPIVQCSGWSTCGLPKHKAPIERFSVAHGTSTGLQGVCKDCMRAGKRAKKGKRSAAPPEEKTATWFIEDAQPAPQDASYGPDVRECPSCKELVAPDGFYAAHRAVGRCILCVQDADRRGAPARTNAPAPIPAVFPDNSPYVAAIEEPQEPQEQIEAAREARAEAEWRERVAQAQPTETEPTDIDPLSDTAPAWHPNGAMTEAAPSFDGPPAEMLSFDVRLRACPIHRELARFCPDKQEGPSLDPDPRCNPQPTEEPL